MLEEEQARTIGKYEVLGPLGRGTMGMVYKGRDPEIGRLVAIKTLRKLMPTALQDADAALEQFRHEARSAGNLRHPNIITIFEAGRDGDTPFIVMDYVEGKTLDKILEREGRLSIDRTLHYLSQVAAALDYAHKKNVIHKDIKPANIFVDNSNTVFILDFGIAAITESYETGVASTGPALGTPGYMSPEQIVSERLDARTDLFSLAIVAFECLAGQRPFVGKTFTEVIGNILNSDPQSLTALAPELPLALEAEFERALSKKKNSRFGSAEDMIDAFARALGVTRRADRGFLASSAGASEWQTPRSSTSSSAVVSAGGVGAEDVFGAAGRGAAAGGAVPSAAMRQGSGFGRERTSMLQALTFVAGAVAVCVALVLFYVVYSPRKPLEGAVAESAQSLDASSSSISAEAAPVESQGASGKGASDSPGVLVKPAVEEVPVGVPVESLSDKQLLGILVDARSPEGSIIESLREATSRKVAQLVDACVQPLQHDSYVVRIEAIKTVAQSGDRRIVPFLISALNDHDPLVRGHAARALGVLQDKRALAPLTERAVSEDVPEVQAAMRNAAERLGGG